MNDKVDVLAVMNYASEVLDELGFTGRSSSLDKARAAVAELIEAAEGYTEAEAELERLTNALNAIAQLDPRHDSEEGWNEWGCATCFHKAQVIANEALRAVK